MENTMTYMGNARYAYTRPAVLTGIFRRVTAFFKSALALSKPHPHGLSDAMEARLYLCNRMSFKRIRPHRPDPF